MTAERVGEQGGERQVARLGLVATDALRVIGLQAILGGGEFQLVLLSSPAALEDDVELVLIDESATDHLLELVAAFRQLRPRVALIVLGSGTDSDRVERLIGAGVKGYLNHAANEAELRMAIGVVRDGSVWAPRKVMARLVANSLEGAGAAAVRKVSFTRREVEVLQLLVLGHPNRQIASALGVDEGTIKAHMGRLMRKAGVDNRTALSMRAIERRWA